jgi:hypothetical protein
MNTCPSLRERGAILLLGTLVALNALAVRTAHADNDFKVYSPYVIQDRSEIEFAGFSYQDGNPGLNDAQGYDFSVAYGVTDWWKSEIYLAQFNHDPGGGTHFSGNEFENTFQLAQMGEYWVDPGFIISYDHIKTSNTPDVLEFGPLFQKRVNRINQRLNLIWEKEIGGSASGKFEFRSSYSVNYRITSAVQPGLEAYYRPNDKASHLGPVISGELYTIAGSETEYTLGVVFGLNSQSPDRVLIARLEFEF